MTDVITTDVRAARHTRLSWLPRWNQLTIMGGRLMVGITAAVAQSFTMAYVEPYRRWPHEDVDADTQTRDPNW